MFRIHNGQRHPQGARAARGADSAPESADLSCLVPEPGRESGLDYPNPSLAQKGIGWCVWCAPYAQGRSCRTTQGQSQEDQQGWEGRVQSWSCAHPELHLMYSLLTAALYPPTCIYVEKLASEESRNSDLSINLVLFCFAFNEPEARSSPCDICQIVCKLGHFPFCYTEIPMLGPQNFLLYNHGHLSTQIVKYVQAGFSERQLDSCCLGLSKILSTK